MLESEIVNIKNGLSLLEDKNYEAAVSVFENVQQVFSENKSDENISIALSLLAMSKYLNDKSSSSEVLKLLHDAAFMAQYSKNNTAKTINEYAQGTVDFGENNKDIALIHFNNAASMCENFAKSATRLAPCFEIA